MNAGVVLDALWDASFFAAGLPSTVRQSPHQTGALLSDLALPILTGQQVVFIWPWRKAVRYQAAMQLAHGGLAVRGMAQKNTQGSIRSKVGSR